MIRKYISCMVGIAKLMFLKLFHVKQIIIHGLPIIYPSVVIQVGKGSKLIFNSGISIRRNTEINVRSNAEVEIGENAFLNSNCIITAHKKIVIGRNVEFGPGVMVFDHDHKYKYGYESKDFLTDEIIIGDNVWIGAGSIILRGSHIGDNSVVAAGSIIKGNIDKNTLIYQKRESFVRKINSEG